MINHYFIKLTLSLLLLLVFFSSCNGQNATELVPAEQPKLIKTQGSNEYQNVHCSLQDKNGNLWFGTTGEGVYKFDGKSFTQFTTQDGLYTNTIWCILEDKDGKIWLGTDLGVFEFNGKMFYKVEVIPSANTTAMNYDVWSIMQDRSGTVWFATTKGVYCYSNELFSKFIFSEVMIGFKENNVEYILEDKAGNFWFGGRGNTGVIRFDGKSFTNFKPDADNWVWPVLQDSKGNIWFSNWGGVSYYNGDSIVNFFRENGLCSNNITRIIEDKNGIIWIGSDSDDGGICRYDGKTFTHFTTKDGLVNNSVWTILEDHSGLLWIGTRNIGLCSFDGETFTAFSE